MAEKSLIVGVDSTASVGRFMSATVVFCSVKKHSSLAISRLRVAHRLASQRERVSGLASFAVLRQILPLDASQEDGLVR